MPLISRVSVSGKDAMNAGLVDLYAIHRLVYSMFPKEGKGRDFLFSFNFLRKGALQIDILSKRRPLSPEVGRIETKDIPGEFWKAKIYKFDLWANPVKRDSSSGKLIPLKKEKDTLNWIEKHFSSKGLIAKKGWVEIVGKRNFKFYKNGYLCTLWGVRFKGVFEVSENSNFSLVVMEGIGKAKAFGFGLLKVVPVK